MHALIRPAVAGIALVLAACGNPGGVSDEDYAAYKEAGAPKILYSCLKHDFQKGAACNGDLDCIQAAVKPYIGFIAGGRLSNYNSVLNEAKAGCDSAFEVLAKEK